MNDLNDQNPAASQLLRDSVDDLPVDVDLLVRGGVSRGRAIRRRRRVGASLAAAVVVGAVAVAASVGPRVVGDDGPDREAVGPAGTTGTDVSPAVLEQRDLSVSPEEIPGTFADLVPGEVADDPDSPRVSALGSTFLWEGYGVRVDFTRSNPGPGGPTGTPAEQCALSRLDGRKCSSLPDGTVVETVVPPPVDGIFNQVTSAWAYTPDGWTVMVKADTVSFANPGGASVRALTVEQLAEVAASDEWFSGETRQVATASADPDVGSDLAVAAGDVPAVIGELLGGEVGPISTAEGSEAVDEPDRKIVHFAYDGGSASFVIERDSELATCAELVDPADQPDGQPGGECVTRDGVELLLKGPELAGNVTSQTAMAWRDGYVVSVLASNENGTQPAVITTPPPISMAELEQVALSDRWFSGS